MSRALDHIVWPARDLDGLAAMFRDLGFTVGARNRHPWGTVNHIVQFAGSFIELLGFEDGFEPLDADHPAAPFANHCWTFLTRVAQGAAMLVLRSDDAEADARAFVALGIGRGRLLPFARGARGPDGQDRSVAFTVAFADLPGLGAFTCEQHRPENFWHAAAQRHANGATGIAALTCLSADVPNLVGALKRFAANETGASVPGEHTVQLDGSALLVVPGDPRGAPLSMVEISAPTVSRVEPLLSRAGLASERQDGCVIVDIGTPGGTQLVFRETLA